MDAEEAIWLAELIAQAVAELAHSPGLTIEVHGDANLWLQVLPEESEIDGKLAGFILNFPYRLSSGDPLSTLAALGLKPPPGTHSVEWQDGAFARLLVRPDVPLVGLAHFAGDLLQHIVGAPPGAELTVQIEHGF